MAIGSKVLALVLESTLFELYCAAEGPSLNSAVLMQNGKEIRNTKSPWQALFLLLAQWSPPLYSLCS